MLNLVCLIYTITAGWRESSSFTGFMCQSVSLLGARHVIIFNQRALQSKVKQGYGSNQKLLTGWFEIVGQTYLSLYAKLTSRQQSVHHYSPLFPAGLSHPRVYRVSAAKLRKTQNYSVSLIRQLVWELFFCRPKALTQSRRTMPPCCSIECLAKRYRSGSGSQIAKHESEASVQLPHCTHPILPQEGQTEAQVHFVILTQGACIIHISMVLIKSTISVTWHPKQQNWQAQHFW